jgi:HPt (histidine-containing phosphotransfer) domain-containing protein
LPPHPSETDTSDDCVEVIPPNFRLKRLIGGAASKALNPAIYEKSQKSVEALLPQLTQEVGRMMADLEHAVRHRGEDARDTIWNIAHELRGLAGTAGKKSLGTAADLICRYLNGSPSSFKADPAVLSTIAVVAMQAVKQGADTDPMIKMLLVDSARAVLSQRRREGRGISE